MGRENVSEDTDIGGKSFIVHGDQIYLATFDSGVIRFTIKDKGFEVKQILKSE